MIRIGGKPRGEKIARSRQKSGRDGLVSDLERQVKEARQIATDCGSDWVNEPAFRSWTTVYNVPRA